METTPLISESRKDMERRLQVTVVAAPPRVGGNQSGCTGQRNGVGAN